MSPGNILMVVHSYCPADPRVRREAEALAAAGWGVDVLCLRDQGQLAKETVAGVRYLRLPLRRKRGGVARYAFEYGVLSILATIVAAWMNLFRGYRLVQAHNMPDFLIFCGLGPWLAGVPVLLDLHDPIPELYMSKFGFPRGAPLIRGLTWIEWASVHFANHALASTGAFRTRLVERGLPADKLTVLLNSPDPSLFRPNGDAPNDAAGVRLLFHGTVTERSGVDQAIRAAERVRERGIPLRFTILGDGDFLPRVREMVAEGDRATWCDVRGPIPLEDIPTEIAAADLGVVPNRSGAFSDLALPTRLFEYLRMKRPVIVSRSPAITDVFADEELLLFEPEDEDGLTDVLERAARDVEVRNHYVSVGGAVADRHRWEKEREVYLDVVSSLVAGASGNAR